MRSTHEILIQKSNQNTTSILESAVKIVEKTNMQPGQFRGRIIKILCILAAGFLGCVVSVLVIAFSPPQSEPARNLVAFAMLISLAIIIASIIALTLANLNMLAYNRVRDLLREEEHIRDADMAVANGRVEGVRWEPTDRVVIVEPTNGRVGEQVSKSASATRHATHSQ